MSYGLQIKNNNNEFLISSDMRNLHHYATYSNPSISVPFANYGGLTRFTYTFTLNSNYVPVPFFTTPFSDRYYAIEKISNSGNTWTVQLISSNAFPTTTDTSTTTSLSSLEFNGNANAMQGDTGNYYVGVGAFGTAPLSAGTSFNGDVSIRMFSSVVLIKAEHLVLWFFLFFGSQFPKKPSGLGTPIELPHPKITNSINFN